MQTLTFYIHSLCRRYKGCVLREHHHAHENGGGDDCDGDHGDGDHGDGDHDDVLVF